MAWKIDNAHSEIQFAIKHMMVATVRGRFTRFDGTVDLDEQNPAASAVSVQIDAASIDTNQETRDNHLRSPDFLDAQQFPFLTFESRRVEQIDASSGRIHGELTIRGVTRPVTLDVEYAGQLQNPWGAISAGFSATTKINRKDWGLTWNQALEAGGLLVGEEIKITIDLELVKQAEQPVEQAESVGA